MEAKLKRTTLRACPKEKAFCVVRGDCVRKIDDLASCIESLSDEEFAHHVGPDHDHFAQWIELVLQNPRLAADLRHEANTRDREHYAKTIRDHVAWLRSLSSPRKMSAKKKR